MTRPRVPPLSVRRSPLLFPATRFTRHHPFACIFLFLPPFRLVFFSFPFHSSDKPLRRAGSGASETVQVYARYTDADFHVRQRTLRAFRKHELFRTASGTGDRRCSEFIRNSAERDKIFAPTRRLSATFGRVYSYIRKRARPCDCTDDITEICTAPAWESILKHCPMRGKFRQFF